MSGERELIEQGIPRIIDWYAASRRDSSQSQSVLGRQLFCRVPHQYHRSALWNAPRSSPGRWRLKWAA